jgi:hypothetical protein
MAIPLVFSLISVMLVFTVLTLMGSRLIKLIGRSPSSKITLIVAVTLAVCQAVHVFARYGDDHLRAYLIGMVALVGCFDVFCMAVMTLGNVLDGHGLRLVPVQTERNK